MQEVAQIAGFILFGAMILVGFIGFIVTVVTRGYLWRIVWGIVVAMPIVLLAIGSALFDERKGGQVLLQVIGLTLVILGVAVNTIIAIRQIRKEAVDAALRVGRDGGGW